VKSFRFGLARVLEWRQIELELADGRFCRQLGVLAELDRERALLAEQRSAAEAEVRADPNLSGSDLATLAAFHRYVDARREQLAKRRAEEERKLAEIEAALLEARRRCRLMERLKQRRREEWTHASNAETERTASENYLAQWTERRRAENRSR
jgi:flagellar export protein FliJ